MANKSFDYIIVGGGSSGCVMANRLTENDAVSVLLLKAGGKDSHPYIHMPVGFRRIDCGTANLGLQYCTSKICK